MGASAGSVSVTTTDAREVRDESEGETGLFVGETTGYDRTLDRIRPAELRVGASRAVLDWNRIRGHVVDRVWTHDQYRAVVHEFESIAATKYNLSILYSKMKRRRTPADCRAATPTPSDRRETTDETDTGPPRTLGER